MSEKKNKEETSTDDGSKKKEGETITVKHEFVLPTPEKKDNPEKPKDDKIEDKNNPSDLSKKGEKVEEKTYTAEEYEAMKQRAEEAESVVEISAVAEFEKQKDDFLSLIPDEEKRKEIGDKIGDSPDILAGYQRMTDFLSMSLEKAGVKVTGKSEGNPEEKTDEKPVDKTDDETKDSDKKIDSKEKDDSDDPIRSTPTDSGIPPEPTTGGAETWKAYVDDLYAVLLDPQKSQAEKKEVNRRLDQLFGEIFRAIKEKQQMPFLSVSQCPNCGALLGADTKECAICGWKHFNPRK